MKLSIITVVYNNVDMIEGAIKSVISQDYPEIEYIVIDGNSSDGTLDVVEKFKDNISILISEPDKGIYDALNKGVSCASGDFIAILNSDDLFCNSRVVSCMMDKISKSGAELCFSDMVVVDRGSGELLRHYKANYFKQWMFRVGWMPPHPTCFINKELFNEFGLYSLNYKISGDFDFLVRVFFGRKIKWSYLDKITVKMRQGGISNSGYRSKRLIFNEINHSLKSNSVWSLSIFQLIRYIIRIFEIIIKPKKTDCD